ncbi:MAG: Holliday junction branch migration protein RuvA [Zoogloeaceae bacterium]|jgi:Holliday junction DNA helicase RuvA|nr:Holliday junction branch migration protein RuvA [Zoogloeaceae bacterium]
MIGRLSGLLAEKNPPQILLDVGGVGYEVDVPMSTFYTLPATGTAVTLLIHHATREDGQFLYGFGTAEERAAFRQLIRISGIGARTALAVLSGLSVTELSAAVARQETTRLVRVPGIGKKTAERLLLELKGKMAQADGSVTGEARVAALRTTGDEVLGALIALGYSEKEALAATRELPPELSTSDGIRQALKLLGKF